MTLALRYSGLSVKECLQGDGVKEPAFNPLVDRSLYDHFIVPPGVDVSTGVHHCLSQCVISLSFLAR